MSAPAAAERPYDARAKVGGRRDSGDRVEVITPEGIPLRFVAAHSGDRAVAFFVDLLLQVLAIWGVALIAVWATGASFQDSWVSAFIRLFFFFVWNFYFMFFELRWGGQTPGKRWNKLRVIDRRGGPLTAEAVIVRNFTRNLEFLLPFQVLVAPEQLFPSAPGWAQLLAVLWFLALAFLPMFNKLRLRVGDLIGGTMVVIAPKAVLLSDQGAGAVAVQAAPMPGAPPRAAAAYTFTEAQLDVYGIYELQVLEDVLRKAEDGSSESWMAMDLVAEKIQRKINWQAGSQRVHTEKFLRDFYAALRSRLEHRMLLGERKEDKHSKAKKT